MQVQESMPTAAAREVLADRLTDFLAAGGTDDDARAVAGLIGAGWAHLVLVSHDVFVKAMWTRHGGNAGS